MAKKKETASNGVPLEELDLLGLPYDILLDRAAILEGETLDAFCMRVFAAQNDAQAAHGALQRKERGTAAKRARDQEDEKIRRPLIVQMEVELEKERKLAEIRTGHATHAKHKQLSPREQKIWGIIQRVGRDGGMYCRELDDAGVKPPRAWLEGGCPSTYPKAYLQKTWAKRIQDEKFKVRRKGSLANLAGTRGE